MAGRWEAWTRGLLHLLLPRVCAACRLDLPAAASGPLCVPCFGRLELCAWPVPLKPGSALRCARAAFSYRGPLPALVRAFKYARSIETGRALGEWMAALYPLLPELSGAAAVVPVPLHPARQRERGFNQARVLAEAVARRAGLPVLELLERTRDTRPLWRLGRQERVDNLRGAFRPRPGPPLEGAPLLLVDDVYTTGATLEACAQALRAAGAGRLCAFALAKD